MDINELESFKMSDAIKFHNELNPNLWNNDKLDPEVRKQLLLIAEDFITTLGIKDLAVKDITVSGSNAAYTYTPHSDLDLHVLVDFNELPNNEVYQELFNAKKIIYNDSHNITVHGVPVELYVQDTNLPVVSLGEYSVLNDKWIRIPKKQRANLDQEATRAKFDKLAELVELALQTRDPAKVRKTLDTIKRYRKAGLSNGGEFSPENLAFKAIRKQGGIQDLYDLKNELHSEKLSIEEAASREDAILKIKKLRNLKGRTSNEVENVKRIIAKMMQQWNIQPDDIVIKQKVDPLQAKIAKAAYEKNTAANMFNQEWEQFKKGIFAEEETVTELFNKPYDTTPKDDDNFPDDWHYEFSTDDGSKYIISVFDPYDYPMIAFAQLKDGEYVDDTTNTGDAFRILATVGEVIKKFVTDMEPDQFSFAGVVDDPSRLKLYDRIAQYIKQVSPDYKNVSINNNARFTGGKTGKEYIFHRSTYKQNPDMDEDYDPNGPPPGPEFKPTMPAGTVRVDVSDVYDWYKLGQHISNMKGLGKHDFGQGPPSTILSFGDEDTEHKYIQDLEKTGLTTTDIDPVDPNQPKGMKRQKTDPTFNVNETDDRKAAVLKIQKHLNKKYGANLDLDGKLGPLTLKSINKFMPRAKTGLADEPNKTTAVQGKKLKEAKIAEAESDVSKASVVQFKTLPGPGKPRHSFRVVYDGKVIAYGEVEKDSVHDDEHGASVQEIVVNHTYRRKGIATKIYDAIERKFNYKLHPSDDVKPDGQEFWKSRSNIDEADGALGITFTQEPYEGWNGMGAMITAYSDGDQVGQVIFEPTDNDKNKWYATEVEVEDEFQRKGIATTMYDMAKKIAQKANAVIVPSNAQTSDAKGMWKDKNIWEASGYIPSAKEKNDPRFKTALTVDVKPDAIKKNAKAFGFKTSRAGIPPQARADGKIK